jgi:hypothetical protein
MKDNSKSNLEFRLCWVKLVKNSSEQSIIYNSQQVASGCKERHIEKAMTADSGEELMKAKADLPNDQHVRSPSTGALPSKWSLVDW